MFPADFFARLDGPARKALEQMVALEAGAIANPDEKRRVGHYWLRAPELAPGPEIRSEIEETLRRVKDFAAAVHEGKVRPEKARIFGLKGKAYQRNRDDIERRAEKLEKDMMGDSAAAVDWRGKVWAKAEAAHAKDLTAWREERGAAIREGNDLRAQYLADKQRVDDHTARLQTEQRQASERRQERDRDLDRGPGMGR